MSNKIRLILIVIAGLILLTVGVFASVLLIERFQSNQELAAAEEEVIETTTVLVLSRDLFLGDMISAEDITLASVPVDIAPRSALTSIEAAVGKMVKADLVQGEMLLAHNLADPTNNNHDLSFILSDDHVLMAFPATDVMSRENMIQRGDIIDIFATFTEEFKTYGESDSTGDEVEESETRTFTVDTMQNVSVTAMVLEVISEEENTSLIEGQTTSDSNPVVNVNAFLLALNPQDALILKYLKDTEAVFDIVLRSPTSTTEFSLTPVSVEYIIEYYGLEIYP